MSMINGEFQEKLFAKQIEDGAKKARKKELKDSFWESMLKTLKEIQW